MKEILEREFERPFEDVGENWRASCPLHSEITPSFFVHKETLVGHCFGCDVAGSVEKLLAEYKAVSLKEAEKLLKITPEEVLKRKKDKERKPKAFSESYLSPWPKITNIKYLRKRGFIDNTVIAFGARWDGQKKRVVFPIRNRKGYLIGASGRTVYDEDPKWYHYWHGKIGECLYHPLGSLPGSPLFIVEGIFDAMKLYQMGIENVAALLGSSATKSQLKEIIDLTDEVVLMLDNDEAGRKGQFKLWRDLHKVCKVKSAMYSTKDPGELTSLKDVVVETPLETVIK